MADGGKASLAADPGDITVTLARCAAGEWPPPVGLMQLAMASPSESDMRRALEAACASAEGEARERLAALRDLHDRHPEAWRIIKAIQGSLATEAGTSEQTVRRWAEVFNEAVRLAPEASVALYSLGSPALLEAMTAEIVAAMRNWGFLGRHRRLLDIGCGIGRFETALSGEVGLIVGTDISAAMLAEARWRSEGLDNVFFVRTCGRDLSVFEEGSFNGVFAVDSFPYIVEAGPDLVERHMAEISRVLEPGGDCLILNFSYRADLDRDRREVAELAERFGFTMLKAGTREFALWDGATFHLRNGTGPRAEA